MLSILFVSTFCDVLYQSSSSVKPDAMYRFATGEVLYQSSSSVKPDAMCTFATGTQLVYIYLAIDSPTSKLACFADHHLKPIRNNSRHT